MLEMSFESIAKNFLSAPKQDFIVDRGEGIYLYDSKGNRWIDCASATFNLSLGYSNEEVIEAAFQQAKKLIHVTSGYMTAPIAELTERLLKILPINLNKIHLKVGGGSEANEGAIKMAQTATGKKEVISCYYSHLGQTIYTMKASGNSFRSECFGFSNMDVIKVPAPYCKRCFFGKTEDSCNLECATKIDEILKFGSSGQVAAMIIEPIFGNGDNIIPPIEYIKAIRKYCSNNNIALIFDEIQTGIGRTGEWFAMDFFEVAPDFVSIAKGLGGTGFQVAAIAASEKFCKMDPMHHSFTYGSNVMSAAAAAKTIEIIERDDILNNVKKVGSLILDRLNEMKQKYKIIFDVRGIGLMIGIELADEEGNPDVALTNRLQNVAFENGLIMRTSRYGRGNVIKVRPPLIITEEQAHDLCDRFDKSLETVCKRLPVEA